MRAESQQISACFPVLRCASPARLSSLDTVSYSFKFSCPYYDLRERVTRHLRVRVPMSGTSSESHIEAQLILAFSAAPLVRVIVDSLPWHAHPTSNYCIPHRCLASWSPLELGLIWGSNSPDL